MSGKGERWDKTALEMMTWDWVWGTKGYIGLLPFFFFLKRMKLKELQNYVWDLLQNGPGPDGVKGWNKTAMLIIAAKSWS